MSRRMSWTWPKPRQWLAQAENDLLNADNNLKSEIVRYDTVCFHCRQAAEKRLKAYLAARGVQPPLTPDWLGSGFSLPVG
jgi:HEPN domain-containing protein